MSKQAKSVTLIAVDHVRLESTEGAATVVPPGTVITNCEPELAYILAGTGKARVATEAEIAEANKPKPKTAEKDPQP